VRYLIVVVAALLLAPAAAASQPLGDLNVSNVSIAVNANGKALVTYTAESGRRREVLAWGAINARPPSRDVPQVAFRFDYSGGLRSLGHRAARTFRNACRPYDGPELAFLVTACKAPDGSYWAIQAWQRLLPMRGFAPWLPEQGKFEFHLSHWSGPLAELQVSPNWTYGGRWQGLFGRLTYDGQPVYGFKTPSATRRGDTYARYVYIDAHDSVYGAGWRRESGILVHKPTGTFCHSFVPQKPFPGYPSQEMRPPAPGERYRVTVMGPGVTPVVQVHFAPPGPYSEENDAAANAAQSELLADDARCRID